VSSQREAQLADAVLMIRPVQFASNPLTAASNRFQGKSVLDPEAQNRHAQQEFAGLAALLRESGINVIDILDTAEPHTPDSIFPNNWVSFHGDGRVVLYPMLAENRRPERRQDILEALVQEHGFAISEVVDLTHHEDTGCYLEGTGSLVLDRPNRIAYAGLSTRTHLEPLREFAQRLDYEVVAFNAIDPDGVPIYHTNVVMSVGEKLAVICAEAIADEAQRNAVLRSLENAGHDVMLLSYRQLVAFAGNLLELRVPAGNRQEGRLVALSQQAHDALDDTQLAQLRGNARVVTANIPVIEASAGGSVRCMLAEIHLPTAKTP
jgi:hypothetical protein